VVSSTWPFTFYWKGVCHASDSDDGDYPTAENGGVENWSLGGGGKPAVGIDVWVAESR